MQMSAALAQVIAIIINGILLIPSEKGLPTFSDKDWYEQIISIHLQP